jgi:sterol 3beta-glucosyltransferase
MRIAVLTWGTRGDVQPLLALALALHRLGAQVTFGAPMRFARMVESFGIGFAPLGNDLSDDDYERLMDEIEAEGNPRKQNRMLVQRILLPLLPSLYESSLRAAQSSDLMVAHWLQMGGGLAAQKLGLPWVSVTLHPEAIEPARSNEQERAGREKLMTWLWSDQLQRFRKAISLRAVASPGASLFAPELNLVAVSRHVVPGWQEWSSRDVPAGYFVLPPYPDWKPSSTLDTFLARHPSPVVFTFGSIGGSRCSQTADLLRNAIETVGVPAIVQMTMRETEDANWPPYVLITSDVPHCWLFAKASCIVHHGGAGTTAAAILAGVPSVTVWHMFDQPYWAARLSALNLGPPTISRLALTPQKLAQSIQSALSGDGYRGACARLAALTCREIGAPEAAVLILKTFARGTTSAPMHS